MTDIDEQILHLETGDKPESVEMASAAVLDNWVIAPCGAVELRLAAARGIVSRNRKFSDGEVITTSPIASVDAARRWIRTRNTLYLLGSRHQKMPFVVHVATRKDWLDAWRAACGRVLPDPAGRSLLTIVAKNPKFALKALAA